VKREAGWILILLAALSACSAATGQSPSVEPTLTPSPSPSPTATPVPTPDLAALGQIYLAAVEPANQTLCTFNTVATNPQATTQQLRDVAGAYADALRTFADALRATTWPSPLDNDVRELLAGLAAEETQFRGAAAATTYADVVAFLNAAADANPAAAAAANLLRGDLGIASVAGTPC
jgi:hypothetical protein